MEGDTDRNEIKNNGRGTGTQCVENEPTPLVNSLGQTTLQGSSAPIPMGIRKSSHANFPDSRATCLHVGHSKFKTILLKESRVAAKTEPRGSAGEILQGDEKISGNTRKV